VAPYNAIQLGKLLMDNILGSLRRAFFYVHRTEESRANLRLHREDELRGYARIAISANLLTWKYFFN
jgi:hypothetical protein